jgi:hypothetical protein
VVDVKRRFASGIWNFGGLPFGQWGQHNFYITNKDNTKPFIKADLHVIHGSSSSQPGWANAMKVRVGNPKSNWTRHWYMWGVGPQESRRVGTNDAMASVTVKDRPNAVYITLVDFAHKDWIGTKGWEFTTESWFQVYDIYGNSGKFGTRTTNDNWDLELHDRNILAQTEPFEFAAEPVPDAAALYPEASIESHVQSLVKDLLDDIRKEVPQTDVVGFLKNLPQDDEIIQRLSEVSMARLTEACEGQL